MRNTRTAPNECERKNRLTLKEIFQLKILIPRAMVWGNVKGGWEKKKKRQQIRERGVGNGRFEDSPQKIANR